MISAVLCNKSLFITPSDNNSCYRPKKERSFGFKGEIWNFIPALGYSSILEAGTEVPFVLQNFNLKLLLQKNTIIPPLKKKYTIAL